jgi:hypothetical protein
MLRSIAPRYHTRIATRYPIVGMKVVEEIRRERLAELKKEFGTFAAINAKLGRNSNDATLSQIANASIGSKTSKPKTMGSPQARMLEDKLGKPVGWMDNDPRLIAELEEWRAGKWPFQHLSPEDLASMDPRRLEMIEEMVVALTSAPPAGPKELQAPQLSPEEQEFAKGRLEEMRVGQTRTRIGEIQAAAATGNPPKRPSRTV